MLCYKDQTFCASEVESHTCGREFTDEHAKGALKWWGSEDYPVAYGKFCEKEEINCETCEDSMLVPQGDEDVPCPECNGEEELDNTLEDNNIK